MKESEFIELLNLYLDHEISTADAARLEAEVQANPARRRVYQQYCRMQKACKLAAADFQTTGEAVETPADRKVVAFSPAALSAAAERQRKMNRFYTVGTLVAAAACIAIVFVGHSRQQSKVELAIGNPPPVAQIAAPAAIPVAAVASTSGPAKALGAESRRGPPSFMDDSLFLTNHARAEAVYAAAIQEANNQLAWIEAVQITPMKPRLASDDLHFDATLRPEGRALGQKSNSNRSEAPAEEMVTYQFRR